MKKKLVCLLLTLGLCLSLAACGADPAPAETSAPAETPAPAEAPAPELAFRFATTDRDGNAWNENAFAGQKLTMINFWEPWCPPCVGEMPDLERLYQDYAERGFAILGVYATPDQEEDVDTVLAQTGVSYPILHYCPEFDVFQTGYVPTTVFVNAQGEIVGETQIGGRDYESWAEIIEGLL